MELIYDQTRWIEKLYGLDALWGILIVTGVLVAVISYLLGCFNGAVIVSKYIYAMTFAPTVAAMRG